jgi:hypothetical protein
LETADGAEGDYCSDSDFAERGDVGAHGDFVGCDLVVQAVAGEKGDGDGFTGCRGGVLQDGDGAGRRAPWCRGLEGCDVCEAGEGLQAGAADDGDGDGFWDCQP